jgi:hypothetical protein
MKVPQRIVPVYILVWLPSSWYISPSVSSADVFRLLKVSCNVGFVLVYFKFLLSAIATLVAESAFKRYISKQSIASVA